MAVKSCPCGINQRIKLVTIALRKNPTSAVAVVLFSIVFYLSVLAGLTPKLRGAATTPVFVFVRSPTFSAAAEVVNRLASLDSLRLHDRLAVIQRTSSPE